MAVASLSDIAVPAGRRLISGTMGSLVSSKQDIVAGQSRTMWEAGDSVTAGDSPPELGDDNLAVQRVWYTSSERLQIRESASGDFGALYGPGGVYAARQFHVQTAPGTVLTFAGSSAITRTHDRIVWSLTAQQQTDLQALGQGDGWIFFVTESIPFDLDSILVPAGRRLIPGTMGSIVASRDNIRPNILGVMWDDADAVIAGDDPLDLGDSTLTVNQVRYGPGTVFTITELASGDFGALYGPGGVYAARQFHVQLDRTTAPHTFSGSDANLRAASGMQWNLTAGQVAAFQGIDQGDRWAFFITEPLPPPPSSTDPPLRSVSDVQLWEADRSAQVALADGLMPFIVRFDIQDRLGDFGRLATTSNLTLQMSSPAVVADPPVLTERRIIRVVFSTGEAEEFRIVRFDRDVSAGKDAELLLEPLWLDLGADISSQVIAGSSPTVDVEWYLIGVSPMTALTQILARGARSYFQVGTVDSEFAAAEVFLRSVGNTPLQMLLALCEDITTRTGKRCEWDVSPEGTGYAISLVQQVGGDITHPIRGFGGDPWNRRKMRKIIDATRYFSRVVPLGGADGETVTIADAAWRIASLTAAGVTLEGDPIFFDGMPSATGLRLERASDGVGAAVSGTTAPNSVALETDMTGQWVVGDAVRFREGTGDLTYLANSTAEESAGVKARLLRRTDIPRYPNLLVNAGVTPNLSSWSEGAPEGVEASSADDVTMTREVDPLHVKAGTAALRVDAGTGDFIQTSEITLAGGGYASVWANLRVLTGSVRLALVDSDGVEHPDSEEAIAVADLVLRGLSVGGLDAAAGMYRLRITALEANTEFIVDSWTVTRSSTPFDYAEDMGPVALWNAAAALLFREGGVLPDRLESEWWDLSQLVSSVDAPRIGANVAMLDAGIDATTRIVELRRRLAGGVEVASGKFGRRRPDFLRQVSPLAAPTGPRVDPKPMMAAVEIVEVLDTTWDIVERAGDAIPSSTLVLTLAAAATVDRLLMFLVYNGPSHSVIRVGYWLDVPDEGDDGAPFGHRFRAVEWGGNDDGTFEDATDINAPGDDLFLADAVQLGVSDSMLTPGTTTPFTLMVTPYAGTNRLGETVEVPVPAQAIARLEDLGNMETLPSADGHVPVYDRTTGMFNFFPAAKVVTTTPAATDADFVGQFLAMGFTNAAPVLNTPIPDQNTNMGASDALSLGSYFSDPDGDVLMFEAESSDESKATVSIVGSTLTINSIAQGTTTITVTASDGALTVQDTFTVTVGAPANQAPLVSSALPDVSAFVGQNATNQPTLTSHFSDPDGGTLQFSAVSSNASIATATIMGGKLVVRGVTAGTATISVTATDPGGLTAVDELTATINALPVPAVPTGLMASVFRVLGTDAGTRFTFNEVSNATLYRIEHQGRITLNQVWTTPVTEVTGTGSPIDWSAFYAGVSGFDRIRSRIRAESSNGNSAWSAWVEQNPVTT